jgi:Tfp pilus assembly protein PilN
MRPVNLIPIEDRPGGRRPLRGGPIAYVVIAGLLAALLGITALVVANNQVSELKSEIVEIEGKVSAEEARAQVLSPYAQFHSVREQRVATISSLADSRFNWERVMRELALVLPSDVWLTNLTASANPSVAPDGGANVALRAGVAGPALALVGCASSQDAVAGFIQALKDIDGVTRVGVQASSLGGSSGATSDSAGSASCQTRDFIAQFQIVVAFDAAPATSVTAPGEVPPPVEPASSPESEEEG